jgi:hypothetical protein
MKPLGEFQSNTTLATELTRRVLHPSSLLCPPSMRGDEVDLDPENLSLVHFTQFTPRHLDRSPASLI